MHDLGFLRFDPHTDRLRHLFDRVTRVRSDTFFRTGSLAIVLLAAFSGSAAAQSVVALSTLDPAAGFRIDGLANGDLLGISADAIGDFNGDGLDDFLVAAEEAQAGRGSTYVVFGREAGFPAGVSLALLDGLDGFRLDNAVANGFNSRARGAGDVNGDGLDDLILGLSSHGFFNGRACIVYGRAMTSATVELDALPAGGATCMSGDQMFENVGKSVAALGDFNGDGLDDVAIGTALGDYAGADSGSVYVVFGRSPDLGATVALELLDGVAGFRIDGASADDFFGISLTAGDVNADGLADVIAGADNFAGTQGAAEGVVYVLYGTDSVLSSPLSVVDLDGSNGFRLAEEVPIRWVGRAVASGDDINGDGIDDILIGAVNEGAFVVHGRAAGFPEFVDLAVLDGTSGFRVRNEANGDRVGDGVGMAGDFNGDGVGDLAFGAQFADPNGAASGKVYLLYGSSAPRAAELVLGTLPTTAGVAFHGTASEDYCGLSLSRAGDIDRDHGVDFLFSCHGASTLGQYRGAAYVMRGQPVLNIFADGFEP